MTRREFNNSKTPIFYHTGRIVAYHALPQVIADAGKRINKMVSLRPPKKPKPFIGQGRAQAKGLREKCAAGKHMACVASKCSCPCHGVVP